MPPRKKFSQLDVIFYVYAVLTVIGGVFHFIGLIIQSNFYVGTNVLYRLYSAAGDFNLSITSGTAVLLFTGFGLAIYALTLGSSKQEYGRKTWRRMIGLVLLGGIVYSGYEIWQIIFPEYFDRPFIDMLLAWIATLIMLLPLLIWKPK